MRALGVLQQLVDEHDVAGNALDGHDEVVVHVLSRHRGVDEALQKCLELGVLLQLRKEDGGVVVVVDVLGVALQVLRHVAEKLAEAGRAVELADAALEALEEHDVVVDDLLDVGEDAVDVACGEEGLTREAVGVERHHVLGHQRVQALHIAALGDQHLCGNLHALLVVVGSLLPRHVLGRDAVDLPNCRDRLPTLSLSSLSLSVLPLSAIRCSTFLRLSLSC
mmetsp:Transcript_16597/g.64821  ORF Transcript_16597/g.64821 Transcript_16597/m.64821 type:complete len:222 (-) Transcript_16597:1544-2209(-)